MNSKENRLLMVLILALPSIFSLWGFLPLLLEVGVCCKKVGVLSNPFYFYPYLSVTFAEVLVEKSGIYFATFIGQMLLPTFIFYMLVCIFRRHVSLLWSVTLSLISISSVSGYPLRHFIYEIMSDNWGLLGNNGFLEILNFPIPSFSTAYFLIIYFFSTKDNVSVKSNYHISLFTILFTSVVYINAIDIIFSLAFWFVYFPLKLYRKKYQLYQIFSTVLLQSILTILILYPAILTSNFSLIQYAELDIQYRYISVYFIIPLTLIVVLYFVQRIDPYDVFFRFRHVYLMMFIESVLIIFISFGIINVDNSIIQNRLTQFFLHAYYYLPAIYYASLSPIETTFGTEGLILSIKSRKLIKLILVDHSKYYLIPLIFLILTYLFISGYRYFIHL
jgi:hypothetical protein